VTRLRIDTCLFVVAALLCVAREGRAAPVEFSLKVSPASGTLNDQFLATVQITVAGVNGPDRFWPPDFGEFTILDQRTQQSTQWSYDPVRGQEISNVETRRFLVKPSRAGKLRIGPAKLRLDGRDYETKPVFVDVQGLGSPSALAPPPAPVQGAAPPVPQGAGGTHVPGFSPPDATQIRPTFLHVVVDRPKVQVGEQVTVTWLLYTRSEVLQFQPKPPKLEGFWVETLYEPQSYFSYREEVVGGRAYAVATIAKRALFPTKAGRLVIPPYEADVSTMATSFGSPLRASSREAMVEVDPLPTPVPAGFDPAYVGHFELEATVDRDNLPAGESLTLTLSVKGTGAIRRAKVPSLSLPGFQVYVPRDFDESVDTSSDIVRGERRYRYLMTPTKGGSLALGPIEIPFFDPKTATYEVARADALPLMVVGDPSQVSGAASGSTQDNLIGRDIRPLREPHAVRSRLVAKLYRTRTFWLLVLAPGLAYVLVVLVDGLRALLRRETPRARLRRARGRARKRLRTAELHIKSGRAGKFFGEVARVLNEHIEERAGQPVAAMTREQLRTFLPERGFPDDTVDALVRELENCDFARFAPSASGPGEMRAAMRRVRALLLAVERVRPQLRREEQAA
jgi:hypothetical protein